MVMRKIRTSSARLLMYGGKIPNQVVAIISSKTMNGKECQNRRTA